MTILSYGNRFKLGLANHVQISISYETSKDGPVRRRKNSRKAGG